jgi:hypothetical protein
MLIHLPEPQIQLHALLALPPAARAPWLQGLAQAAPERAELLRDLLAAAKQRRPASRPARRWLMAGVVLAMLAVTLGWLLLMFGRQPITLAARLDQAGQYAAQEHWRDADQVLVALLEDPQLTVLERIQVRARRIPVLLRRGQEAEALGQGQRAINELYRAHANGQLGPLRPAQQMQFQDRMAAATSFLRLGHVQALPKLLEETLADLR